MPLSDLFKKSPKKEQPKEDPFGSPEMQKKRYDAAMEFLKLFQEKIPLVGGKPHAGTVLAVAGRLAGSSLFRSLHANQQFTPGVVVLSEEANEAWPKLMNQFAFFCKQNGTDVMSRPMVTKFPEQDKPKLNVEQVLAEYQDQYHDVMKRHGLDYLDGARAGMILASIAFEYHVKKVKEIDPFVAAGIVAMGVVEGSKTAPPVLGAPNTDITSKILRENDRLVLGERDAAIQEALDHGGSFIDPHPEVLSKLQSVGIDPYMIHEKALLQKIESKIGRIDFVNANVDALYQEWQSRNHTQAPIHVRLIVWLKNNASMHGYEQNGNSWVRK